MHDPIQLMRDAGRRLAVVIWEGPVGPVPLVYALRRVGGPAFLRLASSALGIATAGHQSEDERAARLRGANDDESRAKIEAELEAQHQHEAKLAVSRLLSSPESYAETLTRFDELVQASVFAAGIGKNGVHAGLLPKGVEPRDVCQQLGASSDSKEPMYLRPVRWISAGAPQTDGLSVTDLPESRRFELAGYIVEAFVPAGEVQPFRSGQGAAGDGAPVGQGVQPAAERAAPRRRGQGSG